MANDEHVAKLREGVEARNEWREAMSVPAPNLEGADLQRADLQRADLQRAKLQWANLEGADLQGADLQRANLEGAKLQEVNLSGAKLQEVNLSGANLQRAKLQRANFQGADLQEVNLEGADLQGAKLQGAKLQGAKLPGADLQGANLEGAKLLGADLQRTKLQGTKLQGTNLQRANLQRANLQRANLQRAIFGNTRFGATILLHAKGLEECVHEGKSELDFLTISIAPNLPHTFILQSGWTEAALQSLEALRDGASGFSSIVRTINFPPEHRQAGIGIMNYFAEVMRQKYPDIPATVQITQEELTVRMTIETDDGHREIVEKTLEEYGLVVAEKMVPEAFLDDQYDRMALENKLEMTKMELRMTQQLLQVSERQHEQRIGNLESEITHLREQQNRLPPLDEALREVRGLVGEALRPIQGTQLAQLFRDQLALTQNEDIRTTIVKIQSVVQTIVDQNETRDEQLADLTTYMRSIREQDPNYWDNFKAELLVFLSGVGAGVGGNFMTDAMKDLIEIIKQIG